jgi:protease I
MTEKRLKGKRVLAVIAPAGFRDEELQQPRQILEAEGAEVKVASTIEGTCAGMLGAKVEADFTIGQARASEFDAVVVVGGAGSPEHLWDNPELHSILKQAAEANKVIGGICLSGAVLARAGVLDGKQATVYQTPQTLEELKKAGARYVAKDVVTDGNVVTAEGPAAAKEFGRKLAERLAS